MVKRIQNIRFFFIIDSSHDENLLEKPQYILWQCPLLGIYHVFGIYSAYSIMILDIQFGQMQIYLIFLDDNVYYPLAKYSVCTNIKLFGLAE